MHVKLKVGHILIAKIICEVTVVVNEELLGIVASLKHARKKLVANSVTITGRLMRPMLLP